MRLARREEGRLIFRFGAGERAHFQSLLSLYPCQSADWQPLSRHGLGRTGDEAARLLVEAAEQRRQGHRQWIDSAAGPAGPWSETDKGWELALDPGQAEELLQILNDLRVGAWTRLGCPELRRDEELLAGDPKRAPLLVVLLLADQYEMRLLDALQA